MFLRVLPIIGALAVVAWGLSNCGGSSKEDSTTETQSTTTETAEEKAREGREAKEEKPEKEEKKGDKPILAVTVTPKNIAAEAKREVTITATIAKQQDGKKATVKLLVICGSNKNDNWATKRRGRKNRHREITGNGEATWKIDVPEAPDHDGEAIECNVAATARGMDKATDKFTVAKKAPPTGTTVINRITVRGDFSKLADLDGHVVAPDDDRVMQLMATNDREAAKPVAMVITITSDCIAAISTSTPADDSNGSLTTFNRTIQVGSTWATPHIEITLVNAPANSAADIECTVRATTTAEGYHNDEASFTIKKRAA